MSGPQKIFTTGLWALALFGAVLLLAIARGKKNPDAVVAAATVDQSDLPTLFDLPKFKLLDQDGREVTDDQLRGRPFVASFVFTHCAGPCPMMFAKMAAMQKTVTNPNIKLVTFTVDPERDTPAVLKEKAKQLGAEPGRWV